MTATLYIWLYGLSFSLVLGGIVTRIFLSLLRRYLGISKIKTEKDGEKRVPPWLTGVVERLFFTLVIAFELSGAAISMIGWLTLKMVTNWNRPGNETGHVPALSALLAGLVSMMFAILGGLFIHASTAL